MKKLLATAGALAAGLFSVNASATATSAIDAAVTAQLDQIPTDLSTVGFALLAAAALAISFKWVKGMMFG